jgi:maltose O-acetyltransferase
MRTIVRMTTVYFADDPRTNLERMLAGDLYIADQEIEDLTRRSARLAEAYGQVALLDDEAARAILIDLLGTLGEGSGIRPPLHVDYGKNIHVGARTFVNFNLTALDVATIHIGDDCMIGPNVQLLTPIHPVDPQPRKDKLEGAKPIVIGDNVWLGGGVIVCPGVTIGENSVIGAGSVVTKDIPANVVAVGNPARVIRENIDR